MPHRPQRWFSPVMLAAATGLALAAPAMAQGQTQPGAALPPPDTRSVISLVGENDSLARNTDRYYTNGIRLGYAAPEGALPAPFAFVDQAMARVFGQAQSRWGFAVGQNMYTPRDLRLRNPDPRDRPYGGHLYGEVTLDRRTATYIDHFSLQIGLTGPSSLARDAQDATHTLLGNRQARGWGYQIRGEGTFNLGWERVGRMPVADLGNGFAIDAQPSFGLAGGTVAVYAQAGLRFRFGQGLERDFGPARISPAAFNTPAPIGEGFGWYVFAGVGGRAVARDLFLDGNAFRNTPRTVQHTPTVGDAELGAAIFWRNVRLSYTQDWRTREFQHQPKGFRFGSLSLSVAF
jgi:hypothetical protein